MKWRCGHNSAHECKIAALAESLHMVLKCTKIKVLKVLFKKNFQVSNPQAPTGKGASPSPDPTPLSTFVPRFGACGPTPHGRGIFGLTKFFVLGTALRELSLFVAIFSVLVIQYNTQYNTIQDKCGRVHQDQ